MSTTTSSSDTTHTENAEEAALHRLVFGATATKVAAVAAELGVADRLATGVSSVADLAEDAGLDADALFRLLRALAALDLVTQTGADRFELTPLGSRLRSDVPDSVRAVLTMLWGRAGWAAWDQVPASVRTGRTGWEAAHGQSWVEYYDTHPEASAEFNAAMSQHTRDAAPALIDACDVSRFDTVVDVGGGDGMLLGSMLAGHPGVHGVLYDLPAGLTAAPSTLERLGVADRCRIEPGDFFVDVPPGGDTYLLKQILHDWDDEEAVAILRRCREVMRPGSRVLVLERVLPEVAEPQHAPALLLDVHMLVVTGGRERTVAQFRDLLGAAGFALTSTAGPLPPFGYHVLEAIPG